MARQALPDKAVRRYARMAEAEVMKDRLNHQMPMGDWHEQYLLNEQFRAWLTYRELFCRGGDNFWIDQMLNRVRAEEDRYDYA